MLINSPMRIKQNVKETQKMYSGADLKRMRLKEVEISVFTDIYPSGDFNTGHHTAELGVCQTCMHTHAY